MTKNNSIEKAIVKRLKEIDKDLRSYQDLVSERDDLRRVLARYRPPAESKAEENGNATGFKVDAASKTSIVLGALRAEIESLAFDMGREFREYPFAEIVKRLPDSIKYTFGKAHGIEAIRTAVKRAGKRVDLEYNSGNIVDLRFSEGRKTIERTAS